MNPRTMKRTLFYSSVSALALQAYSAVILAHNFSALGNSNIPADFELKIAYIPFTSVAIIKFYTDAIAALIDESAQSFFDSTPGYHGWLYGNTITIVKSSTQVYPALQHCHCVWALQRYAEIVTNDRKYEELVAGIVVQNGRGQKVAVGALSNKPVSPVPSSSPIIASKASTGRLVARAAAPSPSTSPDPLEGINGPPLAMDSQPLRASNLIFKVSSDGPSKKLPAVRLFLTIIRTVAKLAPTDAFDKIGDLDYVDEETGIGIKLERDTAKEAKITQRDLVLGIKDLLMAMLRDRNNFREIRGRFFEKEDQTGSECGMLSIYAATHDATVEENAVF